VATLIIAFPVTIVWRILEGEWPSQSAGPSAAATQAVLSDKAVDILAACDGCGRLVMALFATIYDMATADQRVVWDPPTYGTPNPIQSSEVDVGAIAPAPASYEILRFVMSVVLSVTTFPSLRLKASDPQPTAWTWGRWGTTATGSMLLGFGLLLRAAPSEEINTELYTTQAKIMSFIYSGLGVIELGLAAVELITMRNGNVAADFDFASTAAASLAAILNPTKLIPDYGKGIVAGVDVVCWAASSVLAFVALGYDSETLAREVPAMAA
jgi:hypothetical protein